MEINQKSVYRKKYDYFKTYGRRIASFKFFTSSMQNSIASFRSSNMNWFTFTGASYTGV